MALFIIKSNQYKLVMQKLWLCIQGCFHVWKRELFINLSEQDRNN